MNEKLAAFQAWAGVDIDGESLADAEVRALWLAWQAGEAFSMERMSKLNKITGENSIMRATDVIKNMQFD